MKSFLLLAALTALTTSNPLPAPIPAIPNTQPDKENSLTICRDGQKTCEKQFNFVSTVQPSTSKIGCLNIDDPRKKMGMHPSPDLNCTLYFYEGCAYGKSGEKTPQGRWLNVFHGLVSPGIDTFDSADWKARGFWSEDGYGQPPKSVLCAPKEGAKGLGGDN